MKHRIATMVLPVGVAALLAMPAFAQQPKHKGHVSRMPMGGGAGLIAKEGVQKELKLTEDQVGQIRRINADTQSQRGELVQGGGGGNCEEMRKKAATLGKVSMDKALAVLSADQNQEWKDLTGEPFGVQFQGFPVFRRPDN